MGKRTPLYDEHVALGGRMVDFGGWDLPIQYPTGILQEHAAVRQHAGLFDVSHMGEISLTGPRALSFADRLVTNDCQKLEELQVLYTPMCYEGGGVVDDLLVYRLPDRVLLVVNAANTSKDLGWVAANADGEQGVRVLDVSSETSQLALQGPRAQAVLQRLTDVDLAGIAFFFAREGVRIAGRPALVSRTGYTGEDGFEVYLSPEDAVHVWREILSAGREDGVVPCGLGARDSLRFEATLPLYGHELDADHNALESGLGPFVKTGKPDFIGISALRVVRESGGPTRRLVGLRLTERGIARQGYPILDGAGVRIGETTSGMPSPTLGEALALGFVPREHAAPGTSLQVEVRGRGIAAEVVKTPFYRRNKQ